MQPLTIGLIREGKTPPDKRVAFTPLQTEEVMQRFPHVRVQVQPSEVRCYRDAEYTDLGVIAHHELHACDVLLGIKEVPIDQLLPRKTYCFFSHTIKKQPYNRKLLQAVLKKNITLIDYEAMKDLYGNRLVAFGRYAGIVGAYNGLWAYGKRYQRFELRRAFDCFDINDLKRELRLVKLPPVKIVLTGAGRVARGAMETLDTAGIRKVNVESFLHQTFDEPVYVQLASGDYHERIAGGHFNREEFHQHPERYHATFLRFTQVADILMAGAFWNPKAPVLFSKADMAKPAFKIRLVADITCDIEGSVPCTVRATSIIDPLYDYHPVHQSMAPALSDENHITVMAIDNLPCELPRSASEEFGRDLIDKILPPLLGDDPDRIIERATLAKGGQLTPLFQYLADYVATTEQT
jgi:saccharopine dehydrogenase (NAD+, L-lysine-forming)